MPRAIPVLAFLAVAMSLIAAFAPGRAPRAREPSTLGPPRPVRGGVYRAALRQDPPTFDPALAGDTTSFTLPMRLTMTMMKEMTRLWVAAAAVVVAVVAVRWKSHMSWKGPTIAQQGPPFRM